jgi:hypothetical protein
MEVSDQLHGPVVLPQGDRAVNTHWVVRWVGTRTGMDDVKKRRSLTLPGLELRCLGRLARCPCYTDYTIPAPKGENIIPNYDTIAFLHLRYTDRTIHRSGRYINHN